MGIEMKIEGMDEIGRMLNDLEEHAKGIGAQGLYDGAHVMSEEIQTQARSIKTSAFRYAKGSRTRNPSPEERDIITGAGAGIAKFDKNGSEIQTSVGYSGSGYVMAAWGKMVPVAKIANAINSGTSFMPKQPFIRKAATKGKARAEAAIVKTIEEGYNKLIK